MKINITKENQAKLARSYLMYGGVLIKDRSILNPVTFEVVDILDFPPIINETLK